MKIAIHNSKIGFHPRWIKYCESNNIAYKIVDCYANDIIEQLEDCYALMWHHWQVSSKDIIKAKRVLFAIEHSGKVVFPNFKTGWHFDDKISQKYLLEALSLPIVPSYHFVDKNSAIKWAKSTNYPKVFKLTRGAGSANVKLVQNKNQALKYINIAFSFGFNYFDRFSTVKERWRKFKLNQDSLFGVLKSGYRIFNLPRYAKLLPKEKYEIYFQDFIPNNAFDIRVIVINEKAFAIKRMVRNNDFRASGSGHILYEKKHFNNSIIEQSFSYAKKLDTQVVAFDFVYDTFNNPLIVEISYGYAIDGYNNCVGYWDKKMIFHEEKFDSCEWMVDLVLKEKEKFN